MAVYSINDLEKLSGIKAHTIRIWEQRYGVLNPKRTKTNIRYYEDDDLKLLLNVALLNKNGIKISKIAKMSEQELSEKIADISHIDLEEGAQLDALTISMIEMDELKFDRIINTNIEQQGFEQTMLKVIYPFLEKLSIMWLTGSVNPVQENFISFLIRQKIISAINTLPAIGKDNAQKIFLYLPEGERQELSLLFIHYLLRSRGMRVFYLGQDITISDLIDANRIQPADYIFTMVTETFAKEPVQNYVDRLAQAFPKTTILLSGYQMVAQPVEAPSNIHILESLDQMLYFVENNSSVGQLA